MSDEREALLAEFRELGRKGFEAGYSAAVDQLVESISATWLAGASGLPRGRCQELLADLRGILLTAAVNR